MKRTFGYIALFLMVMWHGSGGFLFSSEKENKDRSRVLVLGFNADNFNEIQVRFFREMVIRRVSDREIPVVPVMEMESYFQNGSYPRISNIDRTALADICHRLRAGYAVSGSLDVVEKNLKGKRDKSSISYRCTLSLYNVGTGFLLSSPLVMEFNEDMFSFFNVLSEKITYCIESRYK